MIEHKIKTMRKVLVTILIFITSGLGIKAQTPELWGMAGTTIFKTDTGGNNFSVEYTFLSGEESYSSLFLASNNKFYGLARGNGNPLFGSLFEYDPLIATYTKKVGFQYNSGAFPEGNLIEVNGKLYGMTSVGGGNNDGTLFEYDYVLDTIITKHTFNDGSVPLDGEEPKGSLILATNGKLYGMTSKGGPGGEGTVFEYDPITETYAVKADIYSNYHSNPYGNLLQTANGKFYGLTTDIYPGGSSGIIFEFDLANDTILEKIQLGFTNGNIGSTPYGSLIEATNGKLYGMTEYHYQSSAGVIFEYEPITNNYTVEHVFAGTFAEGGKSKGDVFQASNDKLYGMTELGGLNGLGVLFEYDILTGTYTVKHHFTGTNGSLPKGNLIETNFCYPSFYTANPVVVCSGGSYTYADGTISINITVNENHTSTLSGQAANGCDSLITENLSVLPTALSIDTRTGCNIFTWIDGNTYTTSNNTATFNIVGGAANGCDSLVTLDLTINNSTTGTDTRTACNTFTWIDGNTYTTSNNTATFNIAGGAVNGCDSLVTLDLTINNSATGTDTRTACNTFTWIDGNTYTTSNNTATFNLVGGATNGCDSLVTLDLTITTVDISVTQTGTDLTVNELVATYQWLDCNNNYALIPGATFRTYYLTTSGSYAAAITSFGCADTSNCYTITEVGMSENAINNTLVLYPNPTTGVVNMALPVNGDSFIQVINQFGQSVYQIDVKNKSILELNLDFLPDGIYQIRLIEKNNVYLNKIILNKK